jgi:ABC-type uncharacterized transport system substrate-binding protein
VKRLAVALGVGLPLLAWSSPVTAQGVKPRVAFLAFSPLPVIEAPFNSELRRLGWEEGRNLVIARRYTQAGPPLADVAVELVRLTPDVIVVPNAGMAIAVRRETTSIPIVALAAGELVGSGLAQSLARPGGNVTGTQIVQRDLMGKRLQLLKDALGRPTRMAHLFDTTTTAPRSRSDLRRLFETQARGLQMEPLWHEVRDASEFESGFKTLAAHQVQAVMVGGSPLIFEHARQLTELAAKYHMPATYDARVFVEAGGLMAYGVDLVQVMVRGAAFVDKILRGAKPAVLPIEQPTRFQFVINQKAAKAIGITIPPAMLAQADEVIE